MIQIDPIKNRGISEVVPYDDGKDRSLPGFRNIVPERTDTDVKSWADDTYKNANYSIWSHFIEIPLKIASYFAVHSDSGDSTWATWVKGISTLEKLSGTFGDMFRNLIYSHRDKNGKRDDNIGAELTLEGTKEEDSALTIPVINNHIQTKGKFLVSALSLINPAIANDLDWALVHALDSWWWRNLSTNISLGSDFRKKLFGKIFGSTNDLSWESVKGQFKSHINDLKASWNQFNSSTDKDEKNKGLMNICQFSDKTISAFIPIVNILNIAGDIGRPIARRLGIEGLPRNIIRMLSMIDRPFSWVTNIFRFYIPERILQNEKREQNPNIIDSPNILLASIAGDMADFGTTIFEDKIKEANNLVQHSVEIIRRVSGSLINIYFSARRKRAKQELI